MQKSEMQDKLLPALVAARKLIDPIVKERVARVTSDKGSSYEYSYAGQGDVIVAVMPHLLANGIMLSFDVLTEDGPQTATGDVPGGNRVNVTALLEHESGQWRSVALRVPLVKTGPGMNLYQAVGAVITYLTRILTLAILGLASVDDEEEGTRAATAGNEKAQQQPTGPVQQPRAAPKPAPKGETRISPECLDSFEAAMQILGETAQDRAGNTVALFKTEERVAYEGKLRAAAQDLARITLLYAEIMNFANQRRGQIEAAG